MIKRRYVLSALVAMTMVASQTAFADGDVMEGERIAKDWCSSCHEVGSGPNSDTSAPSFATVANTRLLSVDYLDAWLINPKPPMHTFKLSRPMVSNLVAYMRTLEK